MSLKSGNSQYPKKNLRLLISGRLVSVSIRMFFITSLLGTTPAFSLDYKNEGQIDFAEDERFYRNSPETIREALENTHVSESEKIRLAERMVKDLNIPRNLYEILFEKNVHINKKVSAGIVKLFAENRVEHLYRFNSFEATLPTLFNVIFAEGNIGMRMIRFQRVTSPFNETLDNSMIRELEFEAQILEQVCNIAKKSGKDSYPLPDSANSRNEFLRIANTYNQEFIAKTMTFATLPENSKTLPTIQASWEMLSVFRELAETMVHLNLTKDSKFIDDLINTASKTESTDPDFKTYQQGLAFPGYECKAVLRNITPPK